MRSLHSFLMTPRTVYLLVWDMHADPKATTLTFWLESISSKFPHSSVVCYRHLYSFWVLMVYQVIVGTHTDLIVEEGRESEILHEISTQLSEKYSCVTRINSVSLTTGQGLDSIRYASNREPINQFIDSLKGKYSRMYAPIKYF